MNILVAGGAGFIGSHTAERLTTAGHTPIIYDNLSTGHRWAAGSQIIIEADLADKRSLRAAIERHHVEAVIHFAGCAYVGESIEQPRKYFQNNVLNTLNLLDIMLDMDVKILVYSSTCATYGVPRHLPIPETQPQLPLSPYGESKLFVEKVLYWYGKAYGLRWVALRYFNAAGASGQLGESHSPETHLIPLAIEASLTGVPFTIFGGDYPTEDGTAVRDYIHVEDLAAAHLLALKYLLENGQNRAFNLGTGKGHSVRQVVEMIECVAQKPVPYNVAGRRPGDPPVLVADARVAQQVLGWVPVASSLHEIIQSAWAWHVKSRKTIASAV
ncbi:MAG TPA: UDP-glucose 4-epimerase GalE [Terriglobales bacterium]|nr:UDP-glucose 4-epimerase GalE [Terriglobales bacterium]